MAANDLVNTQVETIELTVTPAATNVIRTLLEQRNIPNHALRVFVSGGGCSGMQYGMAFEESPRDFDQTVEVDGVRLIIDPTSMMYLQGTTIDFVDSLM
ncbi:MAG: iron-sulfur cluster assembly accessory protein, partial [Anaerolineae bacterium]|nr:iron-sulfur cluster assembly accessory protein [Anaerolineae bacterium]